MPRAPRLTREQLSVRSGCQAKLGGCDLLELLESASESSLAEERLEDSALLDVSDTRLMLVSTDLAPLVVQDLHIAGSIAAHHGMSDIWASGGQPKWILVTLCIQPDFPKEYAEAIQRGIVETSTYEGARVVGGQTILGPEALAGVTVLGYPMTTRVLRKRGAIEGDLLLMSKPAGAGLMLRGYRIGLLQEQDIEQVIKIMNTSNQGAARIAVTLANAATDISGFGLLGHLTEMLADSQGALLSLAKIPTVVGANEVSSQLPRTIWEDNNLDYASRRHRVAGKFDRQTNRLLLDPQTNGGILVAAPPTAGAMLVAAGFTEIGIVTGDSAIIIDN